MSRFVTAGVVLLAASASAGVNIREAQNQIAKSKDAVRKQVFTSLNAFHEVPTVASPDAVNDRKLTSPSDQWIVVNNYDGPSCSDDDNNAIFGRLIVNDCSYDDSSDQWYVESCVEENDEVFLRRTFHKAKGCFSPVTLTEESLHFSDNCTTISPSNSMRGSCVGGHEPWTQFPGIFTAEFRNEDCCSKHGDNDGVNYKEWSVFPFDFCIDLSSGGAVTVSSCAGKCSNYYFVH
jgi:hypothetical protein